MDEVDPDPGESHKLQEILQADEQSGSIISLRFDFHLQFYIQLFIYSSLKSLKCIN